MAMKTRARPFPWNILSAILSVLLLISLSVHLFSWYRAWEGTRVVSVADGDTVQLADGRRVRLLGIDAPEHGRCMGEEATEKLRSLVMNKHVALEDRKQDIYGRVLANVFAGPALINSQMVVEGLARSTHEKSSHAPDGFTREEQSARAAKLGIFSDACRQRDAGNGCVIKGNIKNGAKTYHLPGCLNYDQTIIDTSYGDQWFCTESEAKKAGFVKASGCLR